MPSDWAVTSNIITVDSTHAQLWVAASGYTTLVGGASNLIVLTANVPTTAPYAAAEALRLTSVLVNGAAAQGDVAVHKVAYFGDASGDGTIHADDAGLVARIPVKLDTGFAAYLLTDPVIIADVTGDGTIHADDASYVAQAAIFMPRPEIPAVPHVHLVTGGTDPTVSVPTGIMAAAGSVVDVPVNIDGPADAGLRTFDLQFTYDTALLDLTNADVKLAGLTASGWNLLVNVNDSQGLIYVSAYGSVPLTQCVGSILNMDFHVPAGVSSGVSAITVSASPNGGLNGGELVLTTVDGSIVVASPAAAQPASVMGRSAAVSDVALTQMMGHLAASTTPSSAALDGLWDATTSKATFVNTGDVLATDASMATLASRDLFDRNVNNSDHEYYRWYEQNKTGKSTDKDSLDAADAVFAQF
jgi:hypothetical protein